MDTDSIDTYSKFWPLYCREHSKPLTRIIHLCGGLAGLTYFVYMISQGHFALSLVAPIIGYFPAWISHFLIEKNRPATWTSYQFFKWSLVSEYRMIFYMATGRMSAEVEKALSERK